MPRPGALLISHAAGTTPAAQSRRERALLEGAALGEIHLHVSSLQGSVLGLGAFHRQPRPGGGDAACWRRCTGGCAVTSGEGFVIVTIGLPHRAALVADDRLALRPEQVMNRCVRGLLAWLRRDGLDPLYPGLDAVTVRRRTLARLAFAETREGPTLFQAIVARSGSFTETAALADRLDPEGVVPLRLQAGSEVTSLAELGRTGGGTDLPALTRALASGYATTFPGALGEVVELDPAVTDELAADDRSVPAPEASPPAAGGASAIEHGVLGQVAATARVAAGRVTDFMLTGDFIAPHWAVTELAARIHQLEPDPDAVRATVRAIFDGNVGYLLGLTPAALEQLVVRSIAEAS